MSDTPLRRVGRDEAETIGLKALSHLAGDEDLLTAFLGESGLDFDDLRSGVGASDPEILGGVLDFLLARDETLLDFTAAAGLKPETVHLARHALPGGEGR